MKGDIIFQQGDIGAPWECQKVVVHIDPYYDFILVHRQLYVDSCLCPLFVDLFALTSFLIKQVLSKGTMSNVHTAFSSLRLISKKKFNLELRWKQLIQILALLGRL